MARYIEQKEIKLSNEEVESIVEKIMTKEGFSMQTYWDGTQVWHKKILYLDFFLYVDGYAGLMNIEAWAADTMFRKVREYSVYNFAGDIFFRGKLKNTIQQVLDAVY